MKFFISIVLSVVLYSCTGKIATSKIALDLKELENKKVISQSDLKNEIIMFVAPDLIKVFDSTGFGYRILEAKKKWSVYEDKEHIIITGSVSRSERDIALFTILYYKGQVVYSEIGNDKYGNYPKNIIPYSKK